MSGLRPSHNRFPVSKYVSWKPSFERVSQLGGRSTAPPFNHVGGNVLLISHPPKIAKHFNSSPREFWDVFDFLNQWFCTNFDMSSPCWDQMVHWGLPTENIPKAKQREAWVKTEPSIKEKEFTPTRLYVPKGLKSICDLWWTTTWSGVVNMQHSKRPLNQRPCKKCL